MLLIDAICIRTFTAEIDAIAATQSALNEMIVYEKHDVVMTGATGLTIYFPRAKAVRSSYSPRSRSLMLLSWIVGSKIHSLLNFHYTAV